MTNANWPAPAPIAASAPTSHKRWWAIGVAAIVAACAAIGVASPKESSSSGGSFYASAGWTIYRAGDLAAKLQRDDGMSSARADCAMKEIVGGTTWLAWQSLNSLGQLAMIRDAESGC